MSASERFSPLPEKRCEALASASVLLAPYRGEALHSATPCRPLRLDHFWGEAGGRGLRAAARHVAPTCRISAADRRRPAMTADRGLS